MFGIAHQLTTTKSGKRKPAMMYPKDFTRYEIAAIGVITVQWAYLEHMLLIHTAELVDAADIPFPSDATHLNFKRRLAAWRQVINQTVKDSRRDFLITLANSISVASRDRNKIAHGLWEFYPSAPRKMKVHSFKPPYFFADNFDRERLVRLADRLGEINHSLSYPPRKGLRSLSAEIPHAYMSRQFLLLATGSSLEDLGLDSPMHPIPPLPQSSSLE
jgi:hypothetical protein